MPRETFSFARLKRSDTVASAFLRKRSVGMIFFAAHELLLPIPARSKYFRLSLFFKSHAQFCPLNCPCLHYLSAVSLLPVRPPSFRPSARCNASISNSHRAFHQASILEAGNCAPGDAAGCSRIKSKASPKNARAEMKLLIQSIFATLCWPGDLQMMNARLKTKGRLQR